MDPRPNRAAGAMTLAVVVAVGYPAAMVLAFLLAGGHPAKSSASADAAHGATIYHECMICHSLDKNGIGPRHQGVFGRKAGSLPDYNYTADELTDLDAKQPELDGSSAAQHQVGNDNIKGMAFNDGYTEFWDQDLESQWANLYQPTDRHYAGGYGYLNVN